MRSGGPELADGQYQTAVYCILRVKEDVRLNDSRTVTQCREFRDVLGLARHTHEY
jgi:hypothetical protein